MKKHLLKSLLALALVLITGNVWAETATFGSDWNTLFGTNYSGTINSVSANSISWMSSSNRVSIKVTNGSSTNGYVKTSDFRAYNGYTILLTAPENCNITSITSTKGGKNFTTGISANTGTLSIESNTINWAGISNSVTLTCSGTVSFATITVEYTSQSTPSKTLTGVVVSGDPNKTTYEAGEEFDPTGLVVTGTYDDSSTDEITSGITWDVTPSGALTAGTTSVSVTATVNNIASAAYVVSGLTVTAALPKITITASSIENFGGSYEKRSWNAGGVSGECYAYRAGSNAPYLMQFNETPYVYNTTAIPGRILSIEIIKGGGTDRAWSVYCAEAPLTSITDGTQIGTAQTVSTSYKWNVPSETNYNYFYITKGSGSTQISEIIITYEAKTLVNIAVSGNPTTTTYTAGETFDPAGLVVTGTYDDNSQKEITTGIEWTFNPATLSEGQTSVSVTATVDAISSDSYTVNGLTVNAAKVLTGIEVAGTPAEFWKGETFNHDGMTVTAKYSNADDEDVTNEATFSTPDMTTAGKKTVTVTYNGKETTYEIEVKTIANTQETAYTVAQAIALIDAGKDIATEVYVKGTVSSIPTAWSTQHNNITYNISDDGETSSQQFQLYRCATNGAAVGDEVIAKGMMTKYGNTYEFSAGNTIVYSVKVATLSIADITVEIDGDITPTITTNVVAGYTVAYTSDNEEVVLAVDDEMVTMGIGTATITATLTADGYKTVQTTFTVEVIKALNSIAVKTAPAATEYKAGDKFNPAGLVITLAYSDASTEDVAYAGNEDKFTFEPSLTTALTTSNTSVAITYAEKETLQTISVRALYTYTITWMANGVKFDETEVIEGDALTLPETAPANVGNYKFQGWTAEENYKDEDTAPEYIVPEKITPAADATYYAVFAKESVEGEASLVKLDGSSTLSSGDNIVIVASGENWTYALKQETVSKSYVSYYAFDGQLSTVKADSKNYLTLSSSDDAWKLGDDTNGYLYNSSSNDLSISTEYNSSWTIAWNTTEGKFSIKNGIRWLSCRNDLTGDNKYKFRGGGTSTANGTVYFDLYKITESTTSYSNFTTILPRSFSAQISDAGFATLYLEFDAAIPTNMTAYTATYEKQTITLHEIEGDVIPAETAVVLKGEAGDYDFEESLYTGEPLENALCGTTEESSYEMLQGTETDKYVYTLNQGDNGVGFFHMTNSETSKLAANRAYLLIPVADFEDGAGTIGFRFGDATQIENVNAAKADKYFDLMGREVLNPAGGIYILNGKKVLVK